MSSSSVLRDTLVERFRIANMQARGFDTGSETIVSLMTTPHAALVIDHRLADGDAEQLVGMLKPWLPQGAAIIVLIPPSQRSRIPALRAAGASGYHITPVRHGAFEKRLAALIAGTPNPFGVPQPAEPAAKPAIAPAAPASAAAPVEIKASGIRVLLAEDNEINTLLTVSLLKRMGHAVEAVRDGLEAVNAVQARSYDLVLMDVHMPGLDGMEATQKIRLLEADTKATRRLPIVALTASAMDADRVKCLAAGMDDFLTKPLDPAALTAVVARWTAAPATTKAA